MAIITISREMGSAGIPIAHMLAEKLGYTLLDGETIKEAALNYGVSPDALENADEKPPAFIEKLDEKAEIDLHYIELIILEYALKGNVIIYGRGGQDLLQEIKSILRVRIIAPFEERVERWAEREWLDPDLARIMVRRSDQQRAGFIKYYFDRNWDDPLGYDLIINTSKLTEETAVKIICNGVKDQNLVDLKQNCKKKLTNLILRKKAEIAILTQDGVDGHHVEISGEDGKIVLSGHVHSDKEKKLSVAAVQKIDGIKEVVNKLRVIEYRNYPKEH